VNHYLMADAPLCKLPSQVATMLARINATTWADRVDENRASGTPVCSSCCDIVHPYVEAVTGRIIEYAENTTS
jgi:hypothetical protein